MALSRFLLCALLMLGPMGAAQAQPTYTQAQIDAAEACDDGRELADGDVLLCTCKARGFDRFIWGTGPYSGHSDICTASRHAGLISKEEGGAVVALGRPGQKRYPEGEANGIKGRSWLSFRSSFDVVLASGGGSGGADLVACGIFDAAAAPYSCTCPADAATGSVWGSGPYTGDSNMCGAARHAGVIGAEGGIVAVTAEPGQASYEGSEANGVTTSGWGSYSESFMVSAVSTPPQPEEPEVAQCAALQTGVPNYDCACPAGTGNGGSVWGTGPYTGDSDICSAARHAGAVGAAGGVITVTLEPGQDSYEGSVANGVTTRSWGSYGQSFMPAARQTVAACDGLPDGASSHTCSCAAGAGAGSVWGSGPYTADSDICTAAMHAGVITQAGGTVRLLVVPGLGSYAGSAANGMQSRDWNAFESSIIFNRN